MKDDTVSRAAVMESLTKEYNRRRTGDGLKLAWIEKAVNDVPEVKTEIIRCKDCRHNHNCDIQYHAQAGDMFFCAGAERRTDETD